MGTTSGPGETSRDPHSDRKKALLELAGARHHRLEELQQLQTLLQDSYEVPLGVGSHWGRKESPQGETTLPLVTPEAEGRGEP